MQVKDLLADMTPGKLISLLTDHAKDYKRQVGTGGVTMNGHMNDYHGQAPSAELVDAVLVDFINYVGVQYGVDWALYARNLLDPKRGGHDQARQEHIP